MHARRFIVILLVVAAAAIRFAYVHANNIIDDVYYWPTDEVADVTVVESSDENTPVSDYPDPEYRHVKDDSVPSIYFTLIQDTVVKAVIRRP